MVRRQVQPRRPVGEHPLRVAPARRRHRMRPAAGPRRRRTPAPGVGFSTFCSICSPSNRVDCYLFYHFGIRRRARARWRGAVALGTVPQVTSPGLTPGRLSYLRSQVPHGLPGLVVLLGPPGPCDAALNRYDAMFLRGGLGWYPWLATLGPDYVDRPGLMVRECFSAGALFQLFSKVAGVFSA